MRIENDVVRAEVADEKPGRGLFQSALKMGGVFYLEAILGGEWGRGGKLPRW